MIIKFKTAIQKSEDISAFLNGNDLSSENTRTIYNIDTEMNFNSKEYQDFLRENKNSGLKNNLTVFLSAGTNIDYKFADNDPIELKSIISKLPKAANNIDELVTSICESVYIHLIKKQKNGYCILSFIAKGNLKKEDLGNKFFTVNPKEWIIANQTNKYLSENKKKAEEYEQYLLSATVNHKEIYNLLNYLLYFAGCGTEDNFMRMTYISNYFDSAVICYNKVKEIISSDKIKEEDFNSELAKSPAELSALYRKQAEKYTQNKSNIEEKINFNETDRQNYTALVKNIISIKKAYYQTLLCKKMSDSLKLIFDSNIKSGNDITFELACKIKQKFSDGINSFNKTYKKYSVFLENYGDENNILEYAFQNALADWPALAITDGKNPVCWIQGGTNSSKD